MPTISMFYGILVAMYVLDTENTTTLTFISGITNSRLC